MTPLPRPSNFDSDAHALTTGLLAGILSKAAEDTPGFLASRMKDQDENYVPRIVVRWQGREFMLEITEIPA
jgi:hypothetical protein